MRVLLSIRPEFTKLIFDGEKRYEFRRKLPKADGLKTALVYATSPISQIVGEFEIVGRLKASPERLWRATKAHAGLSYQRFLAYFEGCDMAYALVIGQTGEFSQPIAARSDPTFVVPQSFRYVRPREAMMWRLRDAAVSHAH